MGAKFAHLYAFDQTKNFFLKHGYEVFAVLENCPKEGHKCYYLKKNLMNYEKEIEKTYLPVPCQIDSEKSEAGTMIVTIRHAKIEDAHVIAEAEREIAKKPGFFCSQPSELTDENVINTISDFIKNKTGVGLILRMRDLMLHQKHKLRSDLPKIYSQDLLNNLFRRPCTKIDFVMQSCKSTEIPQLNT